LQKKAIIPVVLGPHCIFFANRSATYQQRIYNADQLLQGTNGSSNTEYSLHCASGICYSNTTVYYGIHKRSECIPVDCGVTNLIHDCRVVLISRLKSGECGSMCPLKREQATRETQQWVMRRLPTADSIVEIGRKSRSWIKRTRRWERQKSEAGRFVSHRHRTVALERARRHSVEVATTSDLHNSPTRPTPSILAASSSLSLSAKFGCTVYWCSIDSSVPLSNTHNSPSAAHYVKHDVIRKPEVDNLSQHRQRGGLCYGHRQHAQKMWWSWAACMGHSRVYTVGRLCDGWRQQTINEAIQVIIHYRSLVLAANHATRAAADQAYTGLRPPSS